MAFAILPAELTTQILSYVKVCDQIANVQYVCKSWQIIIEKIIYDTGYEPRHFGFYNGPISKTTDQMLPNALFNQNYSYHALLDTIYYYYDTKTQVGHPIHFFNVWQPDMRLRKIHSPASRILLNQPIVHPRYTNNIPIWLRACTVVMENTIKYSQRILISDNMNSLGELYDLLRGILQTVYPSDDCCKMLCCNLHFEIFEDGDWLFTYFAHVLETQDRPLRSFVRTDGEASRS